MAFNQYKLYLFLGIVLLLVSCFCIFALFRHIEIRRLEAENQKTRANNNNGGVEKSEKKHTAWDDFTIGLRVLMIVIFLLILLDPRKRLPWLTLMIAFILVVILSTLFILKGGELPPLVAQRKLEYLAVFALLIFLTGAAITLIAFSILMIKYGNSYFGPARIIGYNYVNDDDDNANNNQNNDDEGERRKLEEDKDDEDGKDDEDNEEENGEDNEEEDNNNEEESGEEEDNENGSGDEGEEQQNNGDQVENALIKVSWGGAWGCPSSPDTYCMAEIETPCELWDLDYAAGYDESPVDWKYWDGDVDYHLDSTFSCGYGWENGNAVADYDPDLSPNDSSAGDGNPYAYIVGDCKTCEANWAWEKYKRRHEQMQGYRSLIRDSLIAAAAALGLWTVLALLRKCRKKQGQGEYTRNTNNGGDGSRWNPFRRRSRDSRADLIGNEGGVTA